MSVCGVLGMSNLLRGLWLIVLFVLIFTDSRLAVAWFMGTVLIVIIVSETSWRTLILSLGAAALFASAVVFVIRYLAEETRTPQSTSLSARTSTRRPIRITPGSCPRAIIA